MKARASTDSLSLSWAQARPPKGRRTARRRAGGDVEEVTEPVASVDVLLAEQEAVALRFRSKYAELAKSCGAQALPIFGSWVDDQVRMAALGPLRYAHSVLFFLFSCVHVFLVIHRGSFRCLFCSWLVARSWLPRL